MSILINGKNITRVADEANRSAIVSDDGQLHVVMQGKIDENNSTETLLTAGQTFIGEATDISPYSALSLFVTSNVNSAINSCTQRRAIRNTSR